MDQEEQQVLKVPQDQEEEEEDKVLKVLQDREEDKEDKVLKVLQDREEDKEDKVLKVLQDQEEVREDRVLKVPQDQEEDKEDKVLKVLQDQQDQQDLQVLHVMVSPWIREVVFPTLAIPQALFSCIQQFQLINRIIFTIELIPHVLIHRWIGIVIEIIFIIILLHGMFKILTVQLVVLLTVHIQMKP
jgi:hypothetical protein